MLAHARLDRESWNAKNSSRHRMDCILLYAIRSGIPMHTVEYDHDHWYCNLLVLYCIGFGHKRAILSRLSCVIVTNSCWPGVDWRTDVQITGPSSSLPLPQNPHCRAKRERLHAGLGCRAYCWAPCRCAPCCVQASPPLSRPSRSLKQLNTSKHFKTPFIKPHCHPALHLFFLLPLPLHRSRSHSCPSSFIQTQKPS
jgi:hypothetical protein